LLHPASFTNFLNPVDPGLLPHSLVLMTGHGEPHPLCKLAAAEMQDSLLHQVPYDHNFGLDDARTGPVIGKMFGVLVVCTPGGDTGYLSAFSGKIAGSNFWPGYVPPVYDSLAGDGFLTPGMIKLSEMCTTIRLHNDGAETDIKTLERLKTERRIYSAKLQRQLFDSYRLINRWGIYKSLCEIFDPHATGRNPPAGAGECAGIKLLQHAFLSGLTPLALSEFWWGASPKSPRWKHREYYACCTEKCGPILSYMLT
jgi:tRNA pseudouridine32 synthase/23S rRNA pseudouridine746 synthase